jgi:hypothetical protein
LLERSVSSRLLNKNKQGEEQMDNKTIIALIVLGIFLISPTAQTTAKDFLGIGGTVEDDSPQPIPRCYIEDTTLTMGSAEEKYNPSTSISATEKIYHRLYKNGKHKGLYVDGSTVTVNPGDEIALYWAANSTGATGNYGGYYAAEQKFTVPCAGEVTASEMPDSDTYQLYAAANNITVRVFNEDNGNLNAATDNETLEQGDVVSLEMNLRGVYEDAWSPFGDGVLVISANGTTYEDFALSCDGAKRAEATVPKHLQSQPQGKIGANSDWAFSIPGLISNEGDYDCSLTIDVADSGVVGMGHSAGGANINLTFYDADWFYNTDTGMMDFGVETDSDADVGFTNYNMYVFVGN